MGRRCAAPAVSRTMLHTLDGRASRLLDLMREADDEAVTLDELAIVGIDDPAAALLALELAGYGLERVTDTSERGHEVPCVRLARPTWPIDASPGPEQQSGRQATPTLLTPVTRVALLTLLGLALLRWALRGR